jgi:hypothetical protein
MTAPAPDAHPRVPARRRRLPRTQNLGNPLGPGPPAASVANPVRVLGDARPAPELVHERLDARNRICNELPQLALIDRLLEAAPEALPLLMATHAPIVSPGNVSSGPRRVPASPAPRLSLALGEAQPSDNPPGAARSRRRRRGAPLVVAAAVAAAALLAGRRRHGRGCRPEPGMWRWAAHLRRAPAWRATTTTSDATVRAATTRVGSPSSCGWRLTDVTCSAATTVNITTTPQVTETGGPSGTDRRRWVGHQAQHGHRGR